MSAILSAFDNSRRHLTLSELARRADLPKSTAHRIVGDLVRHNLLETEDGEIRLGMRVFELGELVPRRRTLLDAARPYLTDLRAATQHTVHLAVLVDREVLYLDVVPGLSGPRLPSRAGGRLPAHATGVGKAILAFSGSAVVQVVLESSLDAMTPYTITRPSLLARQLSTIRDQGIAHDREESTIGVSCVAAPVIGAAGYAVGAVSVSGTTPTIDARLLGPAVRTAALSLSRDVREGQLIDVPEQ